jgi:hypothetical protein
MLEVFIGAEDNNVSFIRQNRESVVAIAPTPNIINGGGESLFEVTWANHLVLVTRVGERFPFLGYMMEDFFAVSFIGLRTP